MFTARSPSGAGTFVRPHGSSQALAGVRLATSRPFIYRQPPSESRPRLIETAAAIKAADTTDLSGLLSDALTRGGSKAKSLDQAPATSAAADNVVSAATQAPQQAEQAAAVAKQALGGAAQSVPPATKQAASSAAQSLKDRASDAVQSSSNAPAGSGSVLKDSAATSLPPSSGAGGIVLEQSSSAAAAPDSVGDALSQLTDGVQSAAAAAQDATSELLDSVSGAASGLLDSGKDAATGLLESTAGLRSAAEESLAAAQSTAAGLLSGAQGAREEAAAQVQGLLAGVQSGAMELQASANSAAATAIDALPPPVQDALLQAKAAAGQVAAGIRADPNAANLLAVPLLVLPAAAWLAGRIGGYKGVLPPADVNELLQREDALLVDIRSNAERVAQGVPDLQRGALGKGAVVPLDAIVSNAPAGRVRKAKRLAADLAALTISELRSVQPRSTKVVLLDRGDGRAVPIAKRLQRFGVQRAFVVQGGFRQWQRDGLEVRGDRDDYAVSQLQLLSVRSSLAAEETVAALSKPASIVLGAAALVFAAGVLVDWKRTLQYIGTGGLLFSALLRTTSYSKPQDLLDDVTAVSNTVGAPLVAIAGTTKVIAQGVSSQVQGSGSSSESAIPGSTGDELLAVGVQTPQQPEVPSEAGSAGEGNAGVSDDGSSSSGSDSTQEAAQL